MKKSFRILLVLAMVGALLTTGFAGAAAAHGSGHSGGHHDGDHHDDADGGHGVADGADDAGAEQDATAVADQAQAVAQQNAVGSVDASATARESRQADDGPVGVQKVDFYRAPQEGEVGPQLYATFVWTGDRFERTFAQGEGQTITLTPVNGGDGASQPSNWIYQGDQDQTPVLAVVTNTDGSTCEIEYPILTFSGVITPCEPTPGDGTNGDDVTQPGSNATVTVDVDQSNANAQIGDAVASNVNVGDLLADQFAFDEAEA